MRLRSRGPIDDPCDPHFYCIEKNGSLRVYPTLVGSCAGFQLSWDIVKNKPKYPTVPYNEYRQMPQHKSWTAFQAVRWAKYYMAEFNKKHYALPKRTRKLIAQWILLCSDVTLLYGAKNLKKKY